MLGYRAQLKWYAEEAGPVVNDSWIPANADSVAPGTAKDGFGIRSTYLPGFRRFYAEPTLQSCCAHPIPGDPEGAHPSQSAFLVRGITVGPVVHPSQVTLALLRSYVQDVCNSRWIAEAAVCMQLRTGVEQVISARGRGDTQSAKDGLGKLIRDHLGATQNQVNRIIPGYLDTREKLQAGGVCTIDNTSIMGEPDIV